MCITLYFLVSVSTALDACLCVCHHGIDLYSECSYKVVLKTSWCDIKTHATTCIAGMYICIARTHKRDSFELSRLESPCNADYLTQYFTVLYAMIMINDIKDSSPVTYARGLVCHILYLTGTFFSLDVLPYLVYAVRYM